MSLLVPPLVLAHALSRKELGVHVQPLLPALSLQETHCNELTEAPQVARGGERRRACLLTHLPRALCHPSHWLAAVVQTALG